MGRHRNSSQGITSAACGTPRVRFDEFLDGISRHLSEGGLPCRGIRPTAGGDLRITLDGGAPLLLWKTVEAGPGDDLRLLGRPLVAAAGVPRRAVQAVVTRLDALVSRLDRASIGRLDLRNREVATVARSAEGLLWLMADALAVGEPAWGLWRLTGVFGRRTAGHERFCLVFASGRTRVECAFLPDADDPAVARAWLKTPLGAAITVRDGRGRTA